MSWQLKMNVLERCVVTCGKATKRRYYKQFVEAKCKSWVDVCSPSNSVDPGGFIKPQTSAQSFGMDRGPHNGAGPGSVGKAQTVMIFALLRKCEAVPLI